MLKKKIVFFRKLSSVGGPSSFQIKFINWLKKNKVDFDFLKINNIFKKKILFINAGTFNLPILFFSLFYKTKLVQRLDGFYGSSNIGINTANFKSYLINFIMQFIRKYLADHIIYQSYTSKKLWDKNFKKVKTSYSIIHNPSFGKYLDIKIKFKFKSLFNIVIVEGNLENNSYTQKILDKIYINSQKLKKIKNIYIFGNIDSTLKKKLLKINKFILKGPVSHKNLKSFYNKNNIIFFGIECNPCCSNSIIEANSYGIPSITLNTGSYKELIKKSGIQINFNSIDDLNLNQKFLNALSKIIKNYQKYSLLSYKNSIKFDPDYIFSKYVNSIAKLIR